MTVEESKALWSVEKSSLNESLLSKSMNKLYKEVDKLITSSTITYEDFTNDMIDMITTVIVEKSKEGEQLDRSAQIDAVCDKLYENYKEQHNNKELREGDTRVSEDTIVVRDELGVCEPSSAEESC